jgi:TPR repeat protein
MLLTTLTAAFMLAAIAGTAVGGPREFFQNLFGSTPYEKALAAYKSRDYATAIRLWMPLAKQGDASAQYYLGVMYQNGSGVPQNDAEAAKWYQLAAEQDNAPAQANLAKLYDDGLGVPKNKAKAMKLYCRAAKNGDPIAQDYLGSIPQSLEEVCPKF